MSDEKRTPKSWTHYLSDDDNAVTLDEYIAGCLSRMLGAQLEATLAARHTEGMLGAIDQLAEQVAANAGLPYARSADIRAALDARRDERRRLASSAAPS